MVKRPDDRKVCSCYGAAAKVLRALADPIYTEISGSRPGLRELLEMRVEVAQQEAEFHSPQREAAIFYGMFLKES